jgi:cyclopropane-fatty-acyl-phospholipid synthase
MAPLHADHAVATTTSILDRLFPPPRPFAIRLWNQTTLPGTDDADFRLVLNHPGALRKMLKPPLELSLGEAFIYGDFDIEGDITAAVELIESLFGQRHSIRELVTVARQLRSLPRSGNGSQHSRHPARLTGAQHSPDRDQAAIQYHYDVGNDFYALWLDHNLQYSCAYFHTGTEDLDTAQEQKMAHICRKLRLQPGERLLDIGCGWGGLALYAAQQYGAHVLGITLSENQVAYANEQIARLGLDNTVSIELRDYRDPDLGTFDKIVSVGMFEHVGRNKLPEYFAQAYQLLKPGGLFLNHGISVRAPVQYVMDHAKFHTRRTSIADRLTERFVLGDESFIRRYVFPDGEVIPVSEVNRIAELAGFEVRDVENLREHYALTLRRWVERLQAHCEEAIQLTNETTYRVWRLYMSGVTYGFEHGTNNVYQTLLSKPDPGNSHLPLTRADLYEATYAYR